MAYRCGIRMLAAVTLLALFISSLPAIAKPSVPSALQRAPEARLTAKIVTLPIVMVREFPFVEAEIAGVKGKLMLDTGMQDGLVINDHRVQLAGGIKIGTGFFGSGQSFDVRLHTSVTNVRIGHVRLTRVTTVRSQDARMLEAITPDFLGWIGYGFFADHALKLDYRRLKATFYREDSDRYLRGEKVIAVLPFETRHLPNHPLISAQVGDMKAIASVDTGMYGALSVSDEAKAAMLTERHLRVTADPDTYDLVGLRLADLIVTDLPGLEVEKGPSAAAKSIGIVEETEVELGYAFLRQYKTVWSFRGKRLYLLAR